MRVDFKEIKGLFRKNVDDVRPEAVIIALLLLGEIIPVAWEVIIDNFGANLITYRQKHYLLYY